MWQSRYYNLLTEKKDKKILISGNSLQTLSLADILLGNFTLPNSIILVEEKKRKRGFEIFLIDHYHGDIRQKNIAGKY